MLHRLFRNSYRKARRGWKRLLDALRGVGRHHSSLCGSWPDIKMLSDLCTTRSKKPQRKVWSKTHMLSTAKILHKMGSRRFQGSKRCLCARISCGEVADRNTNSPAFQSHRSSRWRKVRQQCKTSIARKATTRPEGRVRSSSVLPISADTCRFMSATEGCCLAVGQFRSMTSSEDLNTQHKSFNALNCLQIRPSLFQ